MCEETHLPKHGSALEKEGETMMHHQHFDDLDDDDREIAERIEEDWGLGCPKCGRGEIQIEANCQIIVREHELEFAPVDYEYEWVDESVARCIHCYHSATVADFSI